MRNLVVGDIHGEYEKLINVLKKANYIPLNDSIIFLGDYIDRGPDSCKVVQYIQELKVNFSKYVILLKGNHEDMAIKYLNDKTNEALYFHNGGNKTLNSYHCNIISSEFSNDISWLNNLPLIYETDEYIFVHAGFKPGIKLEDQKEEDLLWIRNEFLQADWSNYPKIIIHGHTPVKNINLDEMYLTHRLNVDTGAGKNGKLSLVDLTNKKIYQD